MLDLRTVKPGSLLELVQSDRTHLAYSENGQIIRLVPGTIFMYLGCGLRSLSEFSKKAKLDPGILLGLEGNIEHRRTDLLCMDILLDDKTAIVLVSYLPLDTGAEKKSELPSDFYGGNYLINWAVIARPTGTLQQE